MSLEFESLENIISVLVLDNSIIKGKELQVNREITAIFVIDYWHKYEGKKVFLH